MFQDLFLTIVAAYVLFKILGEFSNRNQRNSNHTNTTYTPPKSGKIDDDSQGEYVDYEEIK